MEIKMKKLNELTLKQREELFRQLRIISFMNIISFF